MKYKVIKSILASVCMLAVVPGVSAQDVSAQDVPIAFMRATYTFTYLGTAPYNGKEYSRAEDYMLQIAPGESRFCGITNYEYEKLMATDEGKALIGDLFRRATVYDSSGKVKEIKMDLVKDDMPKRGNARVVYKQHDAGELRVTDRLPFEDVVYTVPMADLVWEITDSVKTILGYECQRAESLYHGRNWEAWFAPDIPVQEGPWQLCGLPGLIMEARTEGDEYIFVINGVEKVEEPILPMPKKRDYIKTDRIKFLREKNESLEDPAKVLGGNVRNANGKPMGKVKLLHDLIETDYK